MGLLLLFFHKKEDYINQIRQYLSVARLYDLVYLFPSYTMSNANFVCQKKYNLRPKKLFGNVRSIL